MGSLDWMADELRAAGLTVVEYPGWRNRKSSGAFDPRAVIWHHDASGVGPSPSIPDLLALHGNSTTPPPLSQCWVDTFGRWHLIASGRANHAGIGSGWGTIRANRGNEDSIGIETDHTTGEGWPDALLDALRVGTGVLLEHLGASPRDSLAGHKEYAPGRKTDPAGLDMAAERLVVAAIMEDDVSAQDVWAWRNAQLDKKDMRAYLVDAAKGGYVGSMDDRNMYGLSVAAAHGVEELSGRVDSLESKVDELLALLKSKSG